MCFIIWDQGLIKFVSQTCLKWSFNFEFNFGIQNLSQVFRVKFEFKFGKLLKDF
jgi:hypothetical protein